MNMNAQYQKGYVPVTPGGTFCFWLASRTEDEAWAKLLKDAAHMPYRGVAGFKHRGYSVQFVGSPDKAPS